MSIEIIECEQYDEAWWAARNGIPSTSRFKDILAKGRGISRTKYLRQLAGERITGKAAEQYSNAHMERGLAMESEALAMYEFMNNTETQAVGFVRNGTAGSSPDRLVGPDGILEIKTAFPHILIEAIERDVFPPEHLAQCQGQLWVCHRQWLDLAIYWPGMPLYIRRIGRDSTYIAELKDQVLAFNSDIGRLVERIEGYQS